MERLTDYFDVEEKGILRESEELHKVLIHLRYEGKVSRGKNLKAARQLIDRLVSHLGKHQQLQEAVIFPFLQTHIPRQEPVIRFLRSDHADIQKNKERLQIALREMSKRPNRGPEDGKVHEFGVYLVLLLRHHLELEKENIHKAIKKELREDEKREITLKIKEWFAENHHGKSLEPGFSKTKLGRE